MSDPVDAPAPDDAAGLRGAAVAVWSRLWPPSEFVRQLGHTLGTRVLLLPLGIIVSALLARALGPGGRGELAAAAAFATLCMQLSNLGLHTSNTYFVAKDRSLLPALTANTLLLSLGLGGALAALLGVLGAARPSLLPVQGPLVALALAWIPLGLAYLLLSNLLIGIQQVRTRNRIELGQQLLGILLLAALIGLGQITAPTAYAASLAALVVTVGWTLFRLLPHLHRAPRPDAGLLRAHLAYGLKAYFTSLCAYLMMRVDLLMVKYLRGPEEAGYYSVAVNMADLVYMIPSTVGFLLFPRLAAFADRGLQLRRSEQATLAMLALLVPLAAVAAAVVPWAIRLLFGEAFLPAAPAFVWLMPGIVAYGSAFAISFLMSAGLPRPVLVIWALLVVQNVALNWVLIHRLGFLGAAVASSITYLTCFVAFTLYARRLAREVSARMGS